MDRVIELFFIVVASALIVWPVSYSYTILCKNKYQL
jgi:hypothetical protein